MLKLEELLGLINEEGKNYQVLHMEAKPIIHSELRAVSFHKVEHIL